MNKKWPCKKLTLWEERTKIHPVMPRTMRNIKHLKCTTRYRPLLENYGKFHFKMKSKLKPESFCQHFLRTLRTPGFGNYVSEFGVPSPARSVCATGDGGPALCSFIWREDVTWQSRCSEHKVHLVTLYGSLQNSMRSLRRLLTKMVGFRILWGLVYDYCFFFFPGCCTYINKEFSKS